MKTGCNYRETNNTQYGCSIICHYTFQPLRHWKKKNIGSGPRNVQSRFTCGINFNSKPSLCFLFSAVKKGFFAAARFLSSEFCLFYFEQYRRVQRNSFYSLHLLAVLDGLPLKNWLRVSSPSRVETLFRPDPFFLLIFILSKVHL